MSAWLLNVAGHALITACTLGVAFAVVVAVWFPVRLVRSRVLDG